MKRFVLLVGFGVAFAWPSAAHATSITFAASGTSSTGTALKASVTFAINGSSLQVTLANIAASDVMSPSDVLGAVFFGDRNNLTFTPQSAVVGSSSAVWTGATMKSGSGPGYNVGGEWAYAGGLSGAPNGAKNGISSVGLGLFGNANFNGPNLYGQTAVDGIEYGLTSKSDNTSTGNSGVTSVPLIKYQAVFNVGGIPTGYDPSASIFNVTFQFGTSLTEAHLVGVPLPEPSTCVLFATGLLAMSRTLRRRKK